MVSKVLGAIGGVAMACAFTAGARAQIIAQPCETCGVALGAPLPEGVYFVDLENYGQRDGQNNRLGVNIPITAWSTPFSFYDTRLEVLAAIPVFTHIDGATINRVDVYSQALLFILAHDFGNGLNASIIAGPRSPDNFTQAGRGTIADLRASISYVKNGYNATLTLNYGGNLGGKATVFNGAPTLYNDNLFLDYTLTKKVGKFEFGVVGYAQTDISGPNPIKPGSVAVGGLLGYDFGKFTLQAFATREVAVRSGGYSLGPSYVPGGVNGGAETRGYVRLIVPLYVAPVAPAAVTARY